MNHIRAGKSEDKITDVAWFVARRIGTEGEGRHFSALIVRIAIAGIALGLASMLLSFTIFKGFRQEIREKIFSFAAHIQVTKFDNNNSVEGSPLPVKSALTELKKPLAHVEHLQFFSRKPALLKTDDEVNGIVLKGIDANSDSTRFVKNLLDGHYIRYNDSTHSADIIISKNIASRLRLQVGDDIITYFIQEPPRARRLQVRGIYETGIEDFDNLIGIVDNRLIQELNQWGDSLTGGYEIYVKNFEKLPQALEEIYDAMDYNMQIESVTSQYVHFFDWFIMLSRNVVIFLSIILFVACFNTMSILLILIMERTSMIGSLKALGASNSQIRRIFVYNGLKILAWGMLWGNLIALGFGFLQYQYQLIPLDVENYYMNTVPIAWDWPTLLMLNLLMLTLVGLIMLIPTAIIARISPIKSIRFD